MAPGIVIDVGEFRDKLKGPSPVTCRFLPGSSWVRVPLHGDPNAILQVLPKSDPAQYLFGNSVGLQLFCSASQLYYSSTTNTESLSLHYK